MCHQVLATLSAIEGRTGLAISGVFGAGKTRSAAALLAGLLVFDPSLQLMVLTKENVAAHAVAEHLVSLQLPDRIQGKMGRLVGYYRRPSRVKESRKHFVNISLLTVMIVVYS